MKNKVRRTIERHHMLVPGAAVTVALSGGADSMALLFCLLELRDELGIEVRAAHFNHCIRGEEADRDESFVRRVCKENGVELFCGRADVPAIAAERGQGLEECGRDLRYDFLFSVSDGGRVATAHSLSDCEETFLFNLARGSALKGLTSIPPVRGRVIRPLIDCLRAEIEAYCEAREIPFVTDSTNADVHYARNRIRALVIPELKRINPEFDRSFSRCLESVREDEVYLSALADELVKTAKLADAYSVDPFRDAPLPVARRAVFSVIRDLTGSRPDHRQVDEVLDICRRGGAVQLTGGVSLKAARGVLRRVGEPSAEWEREAVFGDNRLPEGVNITICTTNGQNILKNSNKKLLEYALDCDKIAGKLLFTSFRPGDRLSLVSRRITKPVRRLLSEMGVPAEKRASVPVLRDDLGPLWVMGAGVDARAAVTKETSVFLEIHVSLQEEENG